MATESKSRRVKERFKLTIPVRIHCRESLDKEWVEMSRLIDVTPFGARFTIAHLTEEGRLLHLTLPLPRNLRCFDHAEDQYRIWSIVRFVKGIASEGDVKQRFDVGVAFVGKRPPTSYLDDPSKRYDVLASADKNGLWEIRERRNLAEVGKSMEDRRSETRHGIPINVRLDLLDEKGEISASEQTVTENITRRGASIFTSLTIARGRFVRITNSQNGLSLMAAVRAYRIGPDNIPRLHLEFINDQWPLEGIE
jgi:hypothetical protein